MALGDRHYSGQEFSGRVSLPAVRATEADVAFLIRTGTGRWLANGTVVR